MSDLLERFLRYVQINTRSDEEVTDHTPTTERQWELARILEQELKEIGLQDVLLDAKCFLTATLPTNTDKDIPVVGFLAHMDTSPDFNADGVNPQVIENYEGNPIALSGKTGMLLSPDEFPHLKNYIGQTLITTDGTTLLGADDKAGIAEIMTAMAHLVAHPELPHGTIRVAFTPDEETSYGIEHFDVAAFNAHHAYTLDGGPIGEMEFENFNAARAYITVNGKSVHPGDAKDIMVNAMTVFFEFFDLLPVEQRPEYTAGREGYFHLWKMDAGSVERAYGVILIRDHDAGKFDQKKQLIEHCADFINRKYGTGTLDLRIEDQYRNMREALEPVFNIVETAREAMVALGIQPVIMPIRGGTDGARLSYRGLPTPNLFTGGHNFHGPYEYIPLESMQAAVQVILKIIDLTTPY